MRSYSLRWVGPFVVLQLSRTNTRVYVGQPSGATPNSGLNRKEKEEERKKELHRMRDEDRARRAEETVSILVFF